VVSAFSHMSINDPRWVNDAPQQFKPERMLTPAGQKPGWQMPFGYGPR
jgi:cytochrome P450